MQFSYLCPLELLEKRELTTLFFGVGRALVGIRFQAQPLRVINDVYDNGHRLKAPPPAVDPDIVNPDHLSYFPPLPSAP